MRKAIMIMAVFGSLLLTGCKEDLPEDELVNRKETFGVQQDGGDLQASSFPLFSERGYQGERKFYTLSELKGKVKALLGEHYWPEDNLTAAELEKLTGITEDMYVDFLAERQVLDAHIDTMILIHAKEDSAFRISLTISNVQKKISAVPSGIGWTGTCCVWNIIKRRN